MISISTTRKNVMGFSIKGLLILLLILLPNILFYIYAVKDTNAAAFQNSYEIISYLEHGSQLLLMLVLVFRVNKSSPSIKSKYVLGMFVFLMLYYVCWVRYFAGGLDYTLISENILMSMGMAIFPAVYFTLAGKWLGNPLVVGTAITFGIFHTLNTYLNFAM